MKKTLPNKRGTQDGNQPPSQPEKSGWIRKYCGRGIFREIWKNRFVILKTDQLYISEKEVKDEKVVLDKFDLTDYEKCEELRKSKSRSKKSHSKFTLLRNKQPGNTVPNLVFLAVSPEEKESWINALSSALSQAKNRILDEVTVDEESFLAHPTRDRVKIQHSRRPPTRGHLMAVASTSTSDGMLTLDLIQEEDPALDRRGTCADGFCSQHKPNYETSTKSCEKGNPVTEKDCSSRVGRLQKRGDSWQRESATSLDREGGSSPDIPKKLPFAELNKCASEEILSRAGTANRSALRKGFETQTSNIEQEKLGQVRELIALKLERTQQLLLEAGRGSWKRQDRDSPGVSEGQVTLNDTEWLLSEALSNWNQAKQVLQEVKELRHLCKQSARMHTGPALGSTSQPPYRGSLM
ncbi:pleckstrin homology domain-containing family O member 1-like isoform X1 [Hemiscyllium ocellatum]|uniref:pleckstrin homology domain-containing family O member 1-like isoform X1 n=1 Tax=Hemiscyllium ocellatum TaxID=170820 RepID=UPI002965F532|nr:pleckstrin homology domain-containing family O member 1-like isoform X1 [Hemiscyllium ocellatum]